MKGEKTLTQLTKAIDKSRNASLFLGAGISFEAGILPGYGIPMLFGRKHPELLNNFQLYTLWEESETEKDEKQKRELEYRYGQALVTKMKDGTKLQSSFVDWMYESKDEGIKAMAGEDSDIHAAFVIAWLTRIFTHMATTNWDFLLEHQIESIYRPQINPDGYYPLPFDPVNYKFKNGQFVNIDSDHLYYQFPMGEDGIYDDFSLTTRWEIIANQSDLINLSHWTRPIWKIHGSPFFLQCPKCGGFTRWKHKEKLAVGDPCPDHPKEILKPEIIFWGQNLDHAVTPVWTRLKGRLQRSDLIVVCGFSGSGNDDFIRNVIECHPNAWIVIPENEEWESNKVNLVSADAEDLSNMLIEQFLT